MNTKWTITNLIPIFDKKLSRTWEEKTCQISTLTKTSFKDWEGKLVKGWFVLIRALSAVLSKCHWRVLKWFRVVLVFLFRTCLDLLFLPKLAVLFDNCSVVILHFVFIYFRRRIAVFFVVLLAGLLEMVDLESCVNEIPMLLESCFPKSLK